jgi:hypothetical protein
MIQALKGRSQLPGLLAPVAHLAHIFTIAEQFAEKAAGF